MNELNLTQLSSTRGRVLECSYSLTVTPQLNTCLTNFDNESGVSLVFIVGQAVKSEVQQELPPNWNPSRMPQVYFEPSAPLEPL